MNKSPVFDGVCVTQYLVFGVVFWDLFFCLLFLHDVVCFLSVLVVFNTYFCINRHQQHKEKHLRYIDGLFITEKRRGMIQAKCLLTILFFYCILIIVTVRIRPLHHSRPT